jgi:hypothetical protein
MRHPEQIPPSIRWEADHMPLAEMGRSSDIADLWPEPYHLVHR